MVLSVFYAQLVVCALTFGRTPAPNLFQNSSYSLFWLKVLRENKCIFWFEAVLSSWIWNLHMVDFNTGIVEVTWLWEAVTLSSRGRITLFSLSWDRITFWNGNLAHSQGGSWDRIILLVRYHNLLSFLRKILFFAWLNVSLFFLLKKENYHYIFPLLRVNWPLRSDS